MPLGENVLSEIIMVQPNTSLTGSFIRMLPIGLLYASSKVVNKGFPVHILDIRIKPDSWKINLETLIHDKTLLVGFSVMSGVSIHDTIKMSRFIKSKWPKIFIVWGGPHPTFSPDDALSESSVDFVIRGYGSESFYQLVQNLSGNTNAISLKDIRGLSWRDGKGTSCNNDVLDCFEFIDYKKIPYDLIKNIVDYKHFDENERVFPMYSVMGCPYECIFCSSPALYKKIGKKWQCYELNQVIEHIEMVIEKYNATFIYFIDDDSFVDLKHVEQIIDEIERRGINVKLGFRGARVNEVVRMSDDFLEKLARAGTNSLHIGIESGSDRLLRFMKKNITVEQIIDMNKKLARHPEINVFYNFIVGFPTETFEETKMTRDLILKLIKDNPSCCIIPLNKPRPLPGTELYEHAIHYGYVQPKTLEEWGEYEVESSGYHLPWLSKSHNQFIRMMFLCMYFIDSKVFHLSPKGKFRYGFYKILSLLYKPIALLRFKYGFYHFLIEDKFYGFLSKLSL